ncbi:hypothetical protein [Anaerosporobacter sp.]|uniref:hypothetical protein n=1 Tax=Anaerosporobacter sp. TaxID=1872529 RepID=UPI00286EE7C8|nr:hypothetical protein [Anaerosporobacter sp.]
MRCDVEENGEVTNYITDGWSIVVELDKEYNIKRRLVRGYGIVASEIGTLKDDDKQLDINMYCFYHTNEHTDVVMLTDIDGKVDNHYKNGKDNRN